MKTLIAYFKSDVGIFKLLTVLVIATVVGLCVYSHFNSHWVLHASPLLTDYEDCLRNNPTYSGGGRASATTFVIEQGRGEHLIASSATRPDSKLSCPSPAFELFLVSVAISVLILTIIFLFLICYLRKPISHKIWCQIKLFEMIFHGLSSIFLLVGGILFLYSAIRISDWCEAKVFTVGGYRRPRALRDDIDVERTLDIRETKHEGIFSIDAGELAEAPKHIDTIKVLVPGQPQGRSLTRVGGGSGGNDDVDFCRIMALTTEKYWAGGMALFAAILYAIIVYLIYRYAQRSSVGCSFTSATQTQQTGESEKCRVSSAKRSSAQSADQNQNENPPKPSAEMREVSTERKKKKIDAAVECKLTDNVC